MKQVDKEKLIIKYLNKNYKVRKKKFVYRLYDNVEDGKIINDQLSIIFDLNKDFCEKVFRKWANSKGLNKIDFNEAWGLFFKMDFTREIAQDLSGQYGLNLSEELERILIQEIQMRIGKK